MNTLDTNIRVVQLSTLPVGKTDTGRRSGLGLPPNLRLLWIAVTVTFASLIAFLAMRAMVLYFAHPLGTLDGAMQTWFALDAFADGRQLGEDFQSYLGVTMILFLVPFYVLFGSTLFASSLAASAAMALGLMATFHGLFRLMRGLTPGVRWTLVAAGVALFIACHGLDPGNSLRPLRWALPFLMLPFVMPSLQTLRDGSALRAGLRLGVIGGLGMIWSNDAGIPTFGALGTAIVLCDMRSWQIVAKALAGYVIGTVLTVGALSLIVTHGAPDRWFTYNFFSVPGDQIWYFAPWDRETRVLTLSDVTLIASAMSVRLKIVTILLLTSLAGAIVSRMRERGSPLRLSAFIFLSLSALGTSLLPQVAGHVETGYNRGLIVIGLLSPFIVFQRHLIQAIRIIRMHIRSGPALAIGLSVMAIIASLSVCAYLSATTIYDHRKTVLVHELGLRVDRGVAEELSVMRRIGQDFDTAGIPSELRLQSTYPSAIGIVMQARSPTPFGSIIHALGTENRQRFIDVIAERRVAFATSLFSVRPSWADWNVRADWPYFRALHLNYRAVSRNADHILWARRAIPLPEPHEPVNCQIVQLDSGAAELSIVSPEAGYVEVQTILATLPDTRHAEIMTAIETSPFTIARRNGGWSDGPRYGIPTALKHTFFLPVAASTPSKIRLEVLGGHRVEVASCSAMVLSWPEMINLPSFASYYRSAGGKLP